MSRHFDYYGEMARTISNLTQVSGRYPIQAEAERLVVADVAAKLRLTPQSELLEIGCGPGNLLIPLTFMVSSCVGIDHPDVIALLRKRFRHASIRFIEGDFLECEIGEQFDRILIYSVLPTLPDYDALIAFADKALGLLRPDGVMLLGDLANKDKKKRFEQSERGASFIREWERVKEESPPEPLDTPAADDAVIINDELVLGLVSRMRQQGWHAYLCDQPQQLPFGNTREDIVVIGPEAQADPV